MYAFITITAYAFDLFIIVLFIDKLLGKRKKQIPFPIFISCFIFMEIILYLNEYFSKNLSAKLSLMVTMLLSLLTTFGLTFLYDARIWHRIFIAVSFQILALFGEYFCTLIVQKLNPSIFMKQDETVSILMNLGSKIVLYLFILLFILFWNRNVRKYRTLQYHILLFSTPVISLIIMSATPCQLLINGEHVFFYLLLFTSLAILNIMNYLLLEKVFSTAELKMKYHTLEQQMQYQKDKYIQLGAAYKNGRSILHDTKKHYFAISEYIKHKQYDRLQDYLHTSMEKLETTYASINTGNLVIDSFVSNFKTVAKNNSIYFEENISIDANRIPINDYDLCVIIGNLLDNCFNACSQLTHPEKFIQFEMYINDNDTFLIHTKNPYVSTKPEKETPFDYSIKHGYGLDNIKRIAEENHGILRVCKDEYFDIIIIIPIIDIHKRFHPPLSKRDH